MTMQALPLYQKQLALTEQAVDRSRCIEDQFEASPNQSKMSNETMHWATSRRTRTTMDMGALSMRGRV
eukprot:CAMPEP_0177398370 /NCGR_PEP_ID=MMETSP0368-20130122/57864_1 /TAXON_ID=447022 ORGANISM="Scrippsiella hangoei-like, Strain SHHI-4" /NCGR_SAMPLE_ID=MMETSP0368 /ASSEMBLY_ACC=CAM_ASM_000363 /LENGTH=67 /DNA_ID=CAMNT_0018865447 /DNA_START=13 /DNA_END=213 /DNA_ORIENTATION=-